MSSETSSRSTRSPIFSTNSVSNAIDSTVNGGAALPNEWTRRTRFGSAADAFPVQKNGIAETIATIRKNARAALSRCHIAVTHDLTTALPLPPSQHSLAAPSIHRDRPPKCDRSSSRKAVMCLICNTLGRA